MHSFELEAEVRETSGKSESRRLRRAGKLPAIVYGGGKQELPIILDALTVSKLLDKEEFHAAMIDIKVKGARGKNTAMLKSVQYDPIKDVPTHLDFFRVAASDIVHAEVALHLINFEKCPGAVKGGNIETIRHHLDVTCRADSIPGHIDVDCSNLEIGHSIHIQDIKLPEGVHVQELEAEGINFTIVACSAPRVEVETAAETVETEVENGKPEAAEEAGE
ncbi:MAG TPA: 50S ribosomal protein L25/general stress protein Ctc [Mariprofundaceae bacterium]|nr:50S ribosomal protein L25/general stress protein Ctc [Mariprofundaceae bacterium]